MSENTAATALCGAFRRPAGAFASYVREVLVPELRPGTVVILDNLATHRNVEGSHLPTKKTLDMLGIPRTTFYRWYDRYAEGGFEALADRSPRPKSVWNRIPQARRDNLIEFALEHEALTTRELAVKYTDEKRYFVS